MKKLTLDILINTSPEQVWDSIVNDTKYRAWTTVFQESSCFEGGWNKGDAIRFVAFDNEGVKQGMISEIAESIYPNYISIKHLGYITNGVEDISSEAVKKWAPSFENYTFEKINNNTTRFQLDMDVTEEYYDMFLKLWPPALTKLKEISEASNG
jgi:hypothetical protein